MPGHKFNILFLEDNLVSLNFLITTLARELPDVKFVPAISIKEASQKVAEQPFDLFILDIQLPDGNSIDFLDALQKEHVSIPRAIFMTASKVPEFRQRAQNAGAVRFFEKPVKPKEFAVVVRDILALQPEPELKPNAFEGLLSCLTPIDLVQLKCLSHAKMGLEFFTKEGVRGVVYFREGQVVHAATGNLTGEDAFCRIMTWKSGKISELPLPTALPQTIKANWNDLVINAAHLMDQAAGTQ
ncbi:MAG: response regulator [Verrucomicrobiota bacterium]